MEVYLIVPGNRVISYFFQCNRYVGYFYVLAYLNGFYQRVSSR